MKAPVTIAQTHVQLAQPEKNMLAAVDTIHTAVGQGSKLILFPELWTSGYNLPDRSHTSRVNAQLIDQLSMLAQQHQIWIGGSYILTSNDHFYNTFVLISPEPSLTTYYQKVHLFPLMNEPAWLSAGSTIQTAQLPWANTGLAICYDLRFPEYFRHCALAGSQIMLIAAEWPQERIANWQVLLRARAIENQMYVIATNCVGSTGADTFGGYSAIISPSGDILCEASGDDEDLITYEIDMEQVTQIRNFLPVFSNRRPDIY